MPRGLDLALLDNAVARVIPEPMPKDLGGESRRVVFWAGALQRRNYVPVFGRDHAGRPQRQEDGSVSVPLVVPCFVLQAAQAALVWLGQTIDTYLATGKIRRAVGRTGDGRAISSLRHLVAKAAPSFFRSGSDRPGPDTFPMAAAWYLTAAIVRAAAKRGA